MNYTIVSAGRLTEGVHELTLDAPDIAAAARPGQFLHIACGHSQMLRRPISICEVFGHNVRLVYQIRGDGTRWLAGRQPGDTLDVLGPLGRGFSAPEDARVLVVGGGVGVPPMLFCARRWHHARAILGFRAAHLSFLTDEFPHHSVICTDDGSLGRAGFVDAAVREICNQFDVIFACGPKPMLRAVARAADELGIPCQVSLEERMGCGVGACLVCACKLQGENGPFYGHVCKDGPIFQGEEVLFDD